MQLRPLGRRLTVIESEWILAGANNFLTASASPPMREGASRLRTKLAARSVIQPSRTDHRCPRQLIESDTLLASPPKPKAGPD
jgi:hypothetical protein